MATLLIILIKILSERLQQFYALSTTIINENKHLTNTHNQHLILWLLSCPNNFSTSKHCVSSTSSFDSILIFWLVSNVVGEVRLLNKEDKKKIFIKLKEEEKVFFKRFTSNFNFWMALKCTTINLKFKFGHKLFKTIIS